MNRESIIQQSIRQTIQPIKRLTESPLASSLLDSKLIGFGENPHWVNEYHPIVLELVAWLLSKEMKVLLLLENEFWLNTYCDKYLTGSDDEFLRITFDAPQTRILYGEGTRSFYAILRSLHASHPGRLCCRHIDFNMTGYGEREEMALAAGPEKWEVGRTIRRLQKENNLQEAGEVRENFIFQECAAAVAEHDPDTTVFLGGAAHVAKKGAAPLGEIYLQSMFSQLIAARRYTCLNFSFLALTGQFANQDFQSGKMQRIATDVRDVRFPLYDELEDAVMAAVETMAGDQFLVATAGWHVPEALRNTYGDLRDNYDYFYILRRVTPNMPLQQTD